MLAGGEGARHQASVPDLLEALIATVERLASTEEEPAAARLWKGEDGSLLASRLSELMLATALLPPSRLLCWTGCLRRFWRRSVLPPAGATTRRPCTRGC